MMTTNGRPRVYKIYAVRWTLCFFQRGPVVVGELWDASGYDTRWLPPEDGGPGWRAAVLLGVGLLVTASRIKLLSQRDGPWRRVFDRSLNSLYLVQSSAEPDGSRYSLPPKSTHESSLRLSRSNPTTPERSVLTCCSFAGINRYRSCIRKL